MACQTGGRACRRARQMPPGRLVADPPDEIRLALRLKKLVGLTLEAIAHPSLHLWPVFYAWGCELDVGRDGVE
eukprot:5505907-Pyramimonas_sp.AAC.1